MFNGNDITVVKRDRLFYDKYEWSVTWRQTEITVLRNGTDEKKVKSVTADREYWSKYRMQYQAGTWKSSFTPEVLERIETVRQLLINEPGPWKTVFNYDHLITVYTSNPALIESILQFTNVITIKQAAITRPRDTVELVDPKHKFRTYLRSTHVTEDNKQIVANWVKAQGDAVRPGPSLTEWLKSTRPHWASHWNGTERYYFFDHDSKMYETMLSMVLPSSVRKTVELIKKQ